MGCCWRSDSSMFRLYTFSERRRCLLCWQYCEFHLVDERIVGRKPKSLSFEEAAAMPLTTITAWEALYDRLSLYSDTIGSNTIPPGILTSDYSDKKRYSPSSILII